MAKDYSIFNAMNFPVCVIGNDAQLQFFNEKFAALIRSDNDAATLDFQHPFYPEYRKRIAVAYQKALQGDNTKCFAVIRSVKGEQIPVEIYLYPFRENDAVSIVAYFLPVEDRMISFDDAIQGVNGSGINDNVNIFEFSPFPIVRFNKDYAIIALSASTEELSGLTREEVLLDPTRFFNAMLPFDIERLKKNISDIFSGSSTFKRVNELKVTTARKQEKWANAVIYPIYREKRKIMVEVLFEDITRIKQLENKLSVLNRVQIVSDLTKGLLHSFNNLTNVIINRAQMLLQITEKKTVIDGLTIIQKSALDGARQIRRIQDFVSDNDDDNVEESAELIEVIEDAIEFARIHFKVEKKEKGRIISISKQYFSKRHVRGNIKKLREIFVSMIFRVAGLIPIQGVIETELREDDDLVLSMSTQFADIANVDSESSANPMSEIEIRRIAEKINVRIFEEISSDRYLIRAILPDTMIDTSTHPKTDDDTVRIRDMDILIVEDEPALQEILFELFESTGNRVSVCSNGNDALIEFRNNRYDIVISDYGIAGLNGFELLKSVRELNEHVVTVLLSGWILENTARYEKTIDLYLSKPFHLDELIREIAKAVATKQLMAKNS